MGYDFMFMTVRNALNKSFPLEHSEVSQTDRSEDIPWQAFKNWLLQHGGRENGSGDSIWVEYANDGSISFRGASSGIYLDTHADWDDVLDAYLILKSLNQNATILDCQDGRYHDEASFRTLMKEQSG